MNHKLDAPAKELNIISLVDIILLLLIFTMLVEPGVGGHTPEPGRFNELTNVIIDIDRNRISEHPDRIQAMIICNADTSLYDFPADEEFINLSYFAFTELESVRRMMGKLQTFLGAHAAETLSGELQEKGVLVEVRAGMDVPFKLIDLCVRQCSQAKHKNFSLKYQGGPRE